SSGASDSESEEPENSTSKTRTRLLPKTVLDSLTGVSVSATNGLLSGKMEGAPGGRSPPDARTQWMDQPVRPTAAAEELRRLTASWQGYTTASTKEVAPCFQRRRPPAPSMSEAQVGLPNLPPVTTRKS